MADLLASFGIDWRLMIMQAVNFGVLLAALTYLLYKPVLSIIDERRKKIEQGVKDASEAQHKLERAKEDAEQIVGEASGKADEIIAEGKQQAEVKAKEVLAEASERAERIEADAHARAKEVARRALEGSNEEIARTAILAAERLLKKKLA